MVDDELVDLIAEAIFVHMRDNIRIPIEPLRGTYVTLTDVQRNYLLSIAHDIMAVYDNWYDYEDDAIEDFDLREDDLEEDDLDW